MGFWIPGIHAGTTYWALSLKLIGVKAIKTNGTQMTLIIYDV